MGFRLWGLEFRVWGLGLGFRVWGSEVFGFKSLGVSGFKRWGFMAVGPLSLIVHKITR